MVLNTPKHCICVVKNNGMICFWYGFWSTQTMILGRFWVFCGFGRFCYRKLWFDKVLVLFGGPPTYNKRGVFMIVKTMFYAFLCYFGGLGARTRFWSVVLDAQKRIFIGFTFTLVKTTVFVMLFQKIACGLYETIDFQPNHSFLQLL